MLKPERAQQLLDQWRIIKATTAEDTENDEDERPQRPHPAIARLKKLPPKLREATCTILNIDAKGRPCQIDWEKWKEQEQKKQEAGKLLAKASVKERAQVFEALLPGQAVLMEGAWQLLARLPYQRGGLRKPFRLAAGSGQGNDRQASWLADITGALQNFEPKTITPAWLAAWAPHLTDETAIAYLLAAAIDAGGKSGQEVLQILKDSAANQHEIGHMGRHIPRALLSSSRSEAWEFTEKLLLAAQRQEGLRQVVLEIVDEAHPEAFVRMAKLVLDQGLARFSSVARGVDVWFGLMWDSASTKVVNDTLRRAIEYLEKPAARAKAIAGKEPEDVYLALWAAAFTDASAAIKIAEPLLKDKKVEKRYAAATLLARIALPESAAALMPAMSDEDLRVALVALDGSRHGADLEDDGGTRPDGMFERVEALVGRLPDKPVALKPLVWPWTTHKPDRSRIAHELLELLGNRSPSRLLPLLSMLDTWGRARALAIIVEQKKYDAATREVILKFASDPNSTVREHAIGALIKTKLKPEEAPGIEKTLTRKTAEVRRAVIGLLLSQEDKLALASAERLMESTDGNQRQGGLELLRQLVENKRQIKTCQARATAYRAARKKVTKEEETHLTAIAEGDKVTLTLDDALGLLDPQKLTPRTKPQARKLQFFTPAAWACLKSLDEFVQKHRNTPLKGAAKGHENDERLLGACDWWFCRAYRHKSPAEDAENLVLRELWEQWWAERPAAQRDKDGLEILRAYILVEECLGELENWQASAKALPEAKKAMAQMGVSQPFPKLKFREIVKDVLDWMCYLHPAAGTTDFLLDAAEASLAFVPDKLIGKPRPPQKPGKAKVPSYLRDEEPELWFEMGPFTVWRRMAEVDFNREGENWVPAQKTRLWKLLHWADTPVPLQIRQRPNINLLLDAWQAGIANEHDVLEHLLGPRKGPGQPNPNDEDDNYSSYSYRSENFDSLSQLTARPSPQLRRRILALPQLPALIDRCRERILQIELARGETPTPATRAAREISSLYGISTFVRILSELGKSKFKKERYSWNQNDSRAATLTSLLAATWPDPGDTPEAFAAALTPLRKTGLIDDQRLAQIAFIAPQWLSFIEAEFGWPGFTEGVYWYLAHMSYADTSNLNNETSEEPESTEEESNDKPYVSPFERLVAERTPLTNEQRSAGAIDVGWFRRTYEQLGAKRWDILASAGKFAATAQQAAKAQLIGDVILGKTSKAKLVTEIKQKKMKHAVRLLGLFPLPTGVKRQPELVARYKVLQEYQRYAKTLSALSKPGALQAFEIGMANLASTAGYPDPLRMTWALEAESLADLRKGPVMAQHDGVKVTLTLNESSQPQLSYTKGDKPLKSLPPATKKNKKVAEILERNTELKRQASRVRQSLETMMCRGDLFSGEELKQLAAHPLIWPLLSRLILIGEGIAGYPDKNGQALRHFSGKLEPVKKREQLRIAHPYDLLQLGNWPEWQHECFRAERVQPLKQLFRELYVVTKQETTDGAVSRRYAGQQINPKQAMALFGQRGWRTQEEVEKTFYDLGLNASVDFVGGWGSPLEVEGLTIDTLSFRKRDEFTPLPLASIPPRVFSEVMRDLDLVVSVAHRGEVDPEASASTVEMRTALMKETCELLGLGNVRFEGAHAIIEGQLAEYTVHLGSGVVHRQPGGSVCIVAVGAQHRGRLFLPFADDDPRTAEVLSKVMLLARDQEIQDPTILEQLRS